MSDGTSEEHTKRNVRYVRNVRNVTRATHGSDGRRIRFRLVETCVSSVENRYCFYILAFWLCIACVRIPCYEYFDALLAYFLSLASCVAYLLLCVACVKIVRKGPALRCVSCEFCDGWQPSGSGTGFLYMTSLSGTMPGSWNQTQQESRTVSRSRAMPQLFFSV